MYYILVCILELLYYIYQRDESHGERVVYILRIMIVTILTTISKDLTAFGFK